MFRASDFACHAAQAACTWEQNQRTQAVHTNTVLTNTQHSTHWIRQAESRANTQPKLDGTVMFQIITLAKLIAFSGMRASNIAMRYSDVASKHWMISAPRSCQNTSYNPRNNDHNSTKMMTELPETIEIPRVKRHAGRAFRDFRRAATALNNERLYQQTHTRT